MKKSPLTTVLLTILLVSSLTSVWLCWSFISKSRELRSLQGQINGITSRQAGINQLASDVLEYSKTHPAIDPLLESVRLKPSKTTSAPATAPASKPSGK